MRIASWSIFAVPKLLSDSVGQKMETLIIYAAAFAATISDTIATVVMLLFRCDPPSRSFI